MTAPERRRPLPALAFIGVLCLLTAVVWFRVIHRGGGSDATGSPSCPTTVSSQHATPKVVPKPSTVSILVLNSTQRSGIASKTKKQLIKRKFKVTGAENDAAAYGGHGVIKGVAEIRYGPQAVAAAELVRFYFPHAAMQQTDASTRVVTVSLGANFKHLASRAGVRAAMHKSHTKYGKPRPAPNPSPSC
ncbi:MAG TPA: LytR C-terminal domain-containing protein [Jatrophihabitans sp.]|jgi:hypothetical protein